MEKEGTTWGYKAARGLLCLLLLLGVACTKHVEAGYSGILEGSDEGFKSAEEIELLSGKVYYNPFTEDVHTFPHAMQRVTWKFNLDSSDDSKEITFSSFGGAVIKSAMEIGYTYKSDRIPHVFVALRDTNGMVVEDYMWRAVFEDINECAGQLPIEAVYGPQKADIPICALKKLRQRSFVKDNFTVDYLNFVGRLRFDQAIWDAINHDIGTRIRIAADERKDNHLRKAAILDAKAEKEVARIEAEGLTLLNSSLSTNLLDYKRLQGDPAARTCEER